MTATKTTPAPTPTPPYKRLTAKERTAQSYRDNIIHLLTTFSGGELASPVPESVIAAGADLIVAARREFPASTGAGDAYRQRSDMVSIFIHALVPVLNQAGQAIADQHSRDERRREKNLKTLGV